MIGFMGCQAALPGLKLARHIVRSQPAARVLMVNLELCTLHLQETSDLESVLSFLIFADGCAASMVSAEPSGLEIHGFGSAVVPDSREQITWQIGDSGFLMWLDGAVPGTIARGLPRQIEALLGGRDPAEVELWAVHPGGRTVLDAAQAGSAAGRCGPGGFARGAARLRQHELGHGHVRPGADAGAGRAGAAGLRAGVRAWADCRGDALSHRRCRMSWDVAVAGGGLAGAAAAARLAMAGRRVVLFEREPGPHDKVCGEFVSGEAAAELAALGLPPARLGAVPIERVRLVAGRIVAATGLPFAAWGLSRRRLDERLLAEAARGRRRSARRPVRGLAADGAGVRLTPVARRGPHCGAPRDRQARSARLAAGGAVTAARPEAASAARRRPGRALAGHVELVLFAGGYAGLQPVEDGIANLCLVVDRGRFAALGRDWRRLVAAVPHLARRLAGAARCGPAAGRRRHALRLPARAAGRPSIGWATRRR